MRVLTAALFATLTTACINGSIDGQSTVREAPDTVAKVNLLAEFSGCMTQEDWDASSMGDWAQKPVEGGTVCSSCHGQGLALFDTNVDSVEMFTRNRLEVFMTAGGFFTTNDDGSAVVGSTATLDVKGGGLGAHPTYGTGQGDPDYQNLAVFVQLTNDRLAAGDCLESDFPEAPEEPEVPEEGL